MMSTVRWLSCLRSPRITAIRLRAYRLIARRQWIGITNLVIPWYLQSMVTRPSFRKCLGSWLRAKKVFGLIQRIDTPMDFTYTTKRDLRLKNIWASFVKRIAHRYRKTNGITAKDTSAARRYR